ncbi:MAG: His-Xaa-Ser system radical SAM maturase HxsB [Deltaproteobacteria bacterium]|nr:His-Xaa-Ser system radical SAM maturase HxsB [Deltaproteobacteria bacterium]
MTAPDRPAPLGVAPPASGYPGLQRSNHFRFRHLGGQVLLTNDGGSYQLLSEAEFEQLVSGNFAPDGNLRTRLLEAGFLQGGQGEEERTAQLAQRKAFLGLGPYLHVLITSLRCNQACVYCHASRRPMDATEFDMSPEVAERAVQVAMQTPAPSITLEFQGGEPLANFAVVRHTVEKALELNATVRKTLAFSLVSNLSLMDDEKLAFILDHGIQVCTSLDGPEDLHNANRPLAHGNSHAATLRWMERIDQGYLDRGLDPALYHVEALLTVTRQSLGRARDIVDEYVKRGLKAVFLRPLNPFGFARKTAGRIGYGAEEFLAFHREALDYIIALNLEGKEILERLATIFLVKILTGDDPNYLDIRSPCGAGIGQIAYSFDGAVFCCDEARMLHQMGDSVFQIGNLEHDGYGDLIESPVVRSVALASCLEGLPGCADCAYLPFCGTCPVFNYSTQGNIFGRMADNQKCRIHMGLMDHLFQLLGAGDERLREEVFARWVESRDRPYFVHDF